MTDTTAQPHRDHRLGLPASVPAVTTMPDNDWGRLAAHLASEHADPAAPTRGLRVNRLRHTALHESGMLAHSAISRRYDLDQVRAAMLGWLAGKWGHLQRTEDGQ